MSLYAEREDVENVREQSCILRCVCNDEGGGGGGGIKGGRGRKNGLASMTCSMFTKILIAYTETIHVGMYIPLLTLAPAVWAISGAMSRCMQCL